MFDFSVLSSACDKRAKKYPRSIEVKPSSPTKPSCCPISNFVKPSFVVSEASMDKTLITGGYDNSARVKASVSAEEPDFDLTSV